MSARAAASGQPHIALVGAFGVLFGLIVSRVGFTNYDELHRMMTMSDVRMLFTFAGAVSLAALGFYALRKLRPLPPRTLHQGIIPGSLLFGAGWAVCGACPGAALAQLGEGKLWAVVSLAGIVCGTAGFRIVHQRYLRFDRGSCE